MGQLLAKHMVANESYNLRIIAIQVLDIDDGLIELKLSQQSNVCSRVNGFIRTTDPIQPLPHLTLSPRLIITLLVFVVSP